MNWREAETRAREYLSSLGWKILAANYRTRHGEIDIIAQEGDVVVFVEVKSTGGALPHPSEAVDSRKLGHLWAAAQEYLIQNGLLGSEVRADVVEIFPDGRINHIRNITV